MVVASFMGKKFSTKTFVHGTTMTIRISGQRDIVTMLSYILLEEEEDAEVTFRGLMPGGDYRVELSKVRRYEGP